MRPPTTGPLGPPRYVAAAVTAAVALLAMSGCGSDGPADDPAPTAAVDGLTAPGTTLEVGDTATVPRTDGSGVIRLTITAIEAGDSADLVAADYAGADGETPYFVRYQMELVSGRGDGMSMRDYLTAWAGDEQVADLVLFQKFPRCQEVNFTPDDSPGSDVTSCRTYVVDNASPPVDTVRFDNDDAYQDGDGTQITWER